MCLKAPKDQIDYGNDCRMEARRGNVISIALRAVLMFTILIRSAISQRC